MITQNKKSPRVDDNRKIENVCWTLAKVEAKEIEIKNSMITNTYYGNLCNNAPGWNGRCLLSA